MHEQDERRRTRTLNVGPWLKSLLVAGASSAVLSIPTLAWHASKTMSAVNRMAGDYNVVVRQNVSLQIQVHRLTDAVNEVRHDKGLPPIEQQPLVGTPSLESASAARGQVVVAIASEP